MSVISNVKKRQAARYLIDIDIPESTWKPDFDLIDRYQNFANELMRISLLGIAGYGFLISEVCMKDATYSHLLRPLSSTILFGAAFLGLSLVLVLAYRFISSACLFYQVLILRSLKRLEHAHWSEVEKEKEYIFLESTRKSQRDKSLLSRKILVGSSICFAIGFISIIILFWQFINGFNAINSA